MDKSEKQNLHDTAALRALSEGEVLKASIAPHEGLLVVEDMGNNEPDPILIISKNAKPVPNQIRAAKFNARQGRSAALQFRKTAIPLLYLLGAILWCIGGMTLSKVLGIESGKYEENPLLENGILFSIVSIIMGFLLIAGGIFFHYEVRKTEKFNSNQ